jgi:aspartyl-tRNA(Asn)/glutamyl-tRNA(Gln) amidotransferase subunit A
MKLEFAAALDGVDALLTPTTMTTALPLEEVDQTKAPAHYTRFGNFLELRPVAAERFRQGRSSDIDPGRLPRV